MSLPLGGDVSPLDSDAYTSAFVAPPKRKTGGRTTPKGTQPGNRVPGSNRVIDQDEHGVHASSRYTPPIPLSVRESPQWVPVLMFTLFLLGALVILLFYMGLVPGGRSNWYLLAGLGLILGGLFTATKYH
jgi:hypothetical protein